MNGEQTNIKHNTISIKRLFDLIILLGFMVAIYVFKVIRHKELVSCCWSLE